MVKADNWAEEYYSDQATIKKLEADIRHQEDVVRYESDNRKTGQKALQAETKIKQLEEQIRKLKSKWKWMKDMAITKDTTEILRLSGFTVDIDREEEAREIKKAWAKSPVKVGDPVYYNGELWLVKGLYIVWGSNPQRVMYLITSSGKVKHVSAEVVSPSYQSAEKAKIEAKKPKKVKWKSVLRSDDEKPCEEKIFTKGTEDSLVGSQVFARIQGEVRKVLVLREENGRLYVKDPISGTQGWIKSEQVRDGVHNLFLRFPSYEEAEDYISTKLKSKYKDVKIISKPHGGNGTYEIIAKDDDATKGGAIHQYGKDTCTRDYNFEDPKVIEEAIRKIKASGHPDPHYLAGLERALYLAKKERGIKDKEIEKMDLEKNSTKFEDAYSSTNYENDPKHQWNIRFIENEISKYRDRLSYNKIRLAQLRKMVNSGQYGSATNKELQEEQRDYEANQMKIKSLVSMLQRAKGAKDEDPRIAEANAIINLCGGVK